MSDVPVDSRKEMIEKRSMWPIAAVIMAVVFAPALIAWGLGALFN